jgi:hypothetical protein
MSMQTDGIGIGHPHIDDLLNAGYQALGGRIAGIAHIEPDIGKENGIAIAGIEGEAGSVVNRHGIKVIEAIAKEAVIVDQYRVFLTRFIIAWLNQDSLKGRPIYGVPLNKFRISPCEF